MKTKWKSGLPYFLAAMLCTIILQAPRLTADAATTLTSTVMEAENAVISGSFSDDADSASHGSRHIRTRDKGASVTVTFQGTGIKFYTKKGSGAGVIDVTIDGRSAGQCDEYVSGAAQFQAAVFEKMDLGPQNESHTAVFTASESNPHNISDPWYNFDYFEVYRLEDSSDPEVIVSPGDTTYYLDSNSTANGNGTSKSQPFNTLDEINRRQFAPGDKILIKRGSSFTGQLYPKGSGSEEKPIVLDTYGEGEKPLIDGDGRHGTPPSYGQNGPFGEAGSAVYLLNSEYWEISHLRVTNWDASTANLERSGIRIEASGGGTYSHIYIKDCDIFDVRGYRGQDSIWDVDPAGGGSTFYGSRTTHRTGGINICSYTSRNNNASDKTDPGELLDSEPTIFNDILIEGNSIENCDANGITTTNVKGGLDDRACRHTNVVIRNNTIHNVQRAGIIPLYTNGVLVEHNKVDAFQQTGEGYGCGIWCDRANDMIFQYNEVCNGKNTMDGMAFNLDDMTENGIIQYNYIHNNVGGGIMLHVRTNSYNRNHTIRYNLSVNDTHNFADHQAIIVCVGEDANTKIQSAKVYNNTFFNTRMVHPVFKGDQIDFRSNIFYLVNSGMKQKSNAYDVGPNTTFTNNLFAGVHPKDEPKNNTLNQGNISGITPLMAGALAAKEGGNYLPKDKDAALLSAKLAIGSPALKAGVIMENNGGKDLYGNPVSASQASNIGAYNGEAVEKFESEDYGDVAGSDSEPTEFDNLDVIYVEGEDEAVTKEGSFTTQRSEGHGGQHISSKSDGAYVEYRFTGIAVSVITKSGTGAGTAEIYLDGVKVWLDDQYSAAEAFNRLAYTYTFPETGTHTIKLVRTGNKNPASAGDAIYFDCFKIFQEKVPVEIGGTLTKLDGGKFTVQAGSVEAGEGPAANAVDQKTDTYWHSNWSGAADVQPSFDADERNEFTIDLGANYDIQKLEYLPRQDSTNGAILKYKLFYSGQQEGDVLPIPRGIGSWNADKSLKTAVFEKVNARRIQIRVYESMGDGTDKDLISAAEFSVYKVEDETPVPKKITITATAGPGGSVSGGATVDIGSSVNLTALADNGHSFIGWFKDGKLVSDKPVYHVTAEADCTFTARFKKDEIPVPEKVTITATAEPGGSVSGGATVDKGQTVTLKAAANSGYQFSGWYSNGKKISNSPVYTAAALANATFTAKFTKSAPAPAAKPEKPGKPGSIKAASASSSVKLTWKKVSGAQGYEISYYTGKTWKLLKRSTSSRSFKHKGLTYGKNYSYRIRAYKLDGGKKVYGDYSKTLKAATSPKKPYLTVKCTSATSVKLNWKKGTRADGFYIYQKKRGGKYSQADTKSKKAVSCQIKKLKKGGTYTFYVKAYKKSGSRKVYTSSKKVTVKLERV